MTTKLASTVNRLSNVFLPYFQLVDTFVKVCLAYVCLLYSAESNQGQTLDEILLFCTVNPIAQASLVAGP